MNRFLLTLSLLSVVLIHAQNEPAAEAAPMEKAPEMVEQVQQPLFNIPLPIMLAGGAFIAFKSGKAGIAISRALLRHPVGSGTLGVFIIGPALQRTLFAENPETNYEKVAADVAAQARANCKQARQKISTFIDTFEHEHPMVAKAWDELKQNEQVQQVAKVAQKELEAFQKAFAQMSSQK